MRTLLTTRLRTAAAIVCVTSFLTGASAVAESPYRDPGSEEYLWMGASLALYAAGFIALEQVESLTMDEIATLDASTINRFDRRFLRPYQEDHAGDALAVGSFLNSATFSF
jgi:hypothetical protein